MKQIIKHIIIIAALLFTVTASWADGTVNIITPDNGTITSAIEGSIVTLTATPDDGYYITAENITVEKTIDGSKASSRRHAPGVSDLITVTATDANADPSGVTTYTFTIPEGYDAEVSAEFQQRSSIAEATITLANETIIYNGEEQKPAIQSVILNDTELSSDDYTVGYSNNTNAGTATITLTGARKYTGTATKEFEISKATATISFKEDSHTIRKDSIFTAPTAVTSPADLSVDYTSSDTEVVKVNQKTGETTIVGLGSTTITATISNDNYEETSASYTLNIVDNKNYLITIDVLDKIYRITDENKNDVLSDADESASKAPSVMYDDKTNVLILTNAKMIKIISNRTDSLKIYLIGHSVSPGISSTNSNCKLIFTTSDITPGSLYLNNTTGEEITGFSDIKYEYGLKYEEYEQTKSGKILVPIEPIIKKTTEEPPTNTLIEAEVKILEGSQVEQNSFIQVIDNNFQWTYDTKSESGPDPSDNSFIINVQSNVNNVKELLKNDITTKEFAEKVCGVSFILPPGEISLNLNAVCYGGARPFLGVTNVEPVEIKPDLDYTILVKEKSNAVIFSSIPSSTPSNHRIGRKTTAGIGVCNITLDIKSLASNNSPSAQASNYPTSTLPKEIQSAENTSGSDITPENTIEVTAPTGIKKAETIVIDLTKDSEPVYDLQGRRVTYPFNPGVYISQGKKVVIK